VRCSTFGVSAATNKEICRRFFEDVVGNGNLALVDELVAPDVVSHSPFPGQHPGVAGVKETLGLFHEAFPDLAIEIKHLLADDDKVMGYFKVRGTQRGEIMGIAPTGRRVCYDEVVVLRLVAGRIVEHWAIADALALMQQLGAIPN
jgi:predicted ester cyclase